MFLLCSRGRGSLRPSRPARGTIMRCHDVGAGCGSRVRGPHQPRPRADPRATGSGALRRRSVWTRKRQKPGCRLWRVGWRDASFARCVRFADHEPPGAIRAGLAKSRPRVISARHSPRTQTSLRSLRKLDCGGDGKRDGPPRARTKTGAGEALPLFPSPHHHAV